MTASGRGWSQVGLSVLLSWFLSAGALAETVTVRADQWFPVNGSPNAARPGFGIEILSDAWKGSGYRLDYRLAPWSRSLEMVRAGELDCVIGAFLSDAPDLRFPRHPLAFDTSGFYVRTDSAWRYRGPDSLAHVTLGVIGSYSYGDPVDGWIHEHRENGKVQAARGLQPLEKNIRKLLTGRVDVLVESPLVMASKLEEMGLENQVREAGHLSRPMPLYVACSPKQDKAVDWLRAFDKGFSRLQKSGRLDAIYRRYGVDPRQQAEWRKKYGTDAGRSAPDAGR